MVWLAFEDVCNLLNISPRTGRRYIKNNIYLIRYVNGIGRGGKILQIALESLPQEAQDRYHGNKPEQDTSGQAYLYMTAKQREEVSIKHNAVIDYREHKQVWPGTDKLVSFIAIYNKRNPENPITKNQILSWETKYSKGGLAALVDRRGLNSKPETTIPEDVWQYFLSLWLKESKPSIQSCYEMTAHFFDSNGRSIPSVSSFNRAVNNFRILPKTVKIRYREGKKSFEDKCLPYIQTDYSSMYSNQQWVADHHVFDVLVENENGVVFRPWLSAWMDRKSRRIVGYVINQSSPNSDIVLESFADACFQHGIPDGVLLDNGKDYKVFDLFNNSFDKSLAREMNIKVTNALPYNAKAKPIERLFRTLEEKYCKHLPSYIGNNPKKRPEHMNKVNAKLRGIAMPFHEFLTFVENMIKVYNHSPHSSLNGKTPHETYINSFTKTKRVVSDKAALDMFLLRTTKALTVGRMGIRVPALSLYFDSEKLLPYRGEKVFVRYSPKDVRKAYVFDEKDEFICLSYSQQLSQYDSPVTSEHIRENARKKKALHRHNKEYFTVKENTFIQTCLTEKAAKVPEDSEKKPIAYIAPIKNKHAKAIQKAEEKQKVYDKCKKKPNQRTKQDEAAEYFRHLTGG